MIKCAHNLFDGERIMFFITLLLVIFFLIESSIKLTGWNHYVYKAQLSFFKRYGLNKVSMFIVGLVEMCASCALIVGLIVDIVYLSNLGALMIALTSIGAIYFHLRFDTAKDAIAAFITLTLSIFLLVNQMS